MRVVAAPAGRILAIAAHPDDIESWCAGTLAQAVDAGAAIRLLLVTSGEHGSADPQAIPVQVAAQREAEARAAATILGLTDVMFLRYPDGDVENTSDLRADLVAAIRRWQPEVLFTHDPEHPDPPYLSHRDHRVVGRAVLDAVYPLARDPLPFAAHPAVVGLAPHAVGTVWLWASTQADAAVDITTGFDRKLAARLAHRSQTTEAADLAAHWRQRAARIGASVSVPLAEAFVVLSLD